MKKIKETLLGYDSNGGILNTYVGKILSILKQIKGTLHDCGFMAIIINYHVYLEF